MGLTGSGGVNRGLQRQSSLLCLLLIAPICQSNPLPSHATPGALYATCTHPAGQTPSPPYHDLLTEARARRGGGEEGVLGWGPCRWVDVLPRQFFYAEARGGKGGFYGRGHAEGSCFASRSFAMLLCHLAQQGTSAAVLCSRLHYL